LTLNLSLGCAPFKIWVKQKEMKQTIEEAAMNFANYESNNLDKLPFKVKNVVDYDNGLTRGFKAGAEWQSKQAIEILSSVLENWVHGGDADCIIAEFEEKLKNNVWNIQQKQQKGISSFDEILEANKDVLERIKQKGD
jgi:hypothetical protein